MEQTSINAQRDVRRDSAGRDRWAAIAAAHAQSEEEAVAARLAELPFTAGERQRIVHRARELVAGCRRRASERSLLDLFLAEFGLSNEEGIALMCISEALLRIPDDDTAEALVAEKIGTANWHQHLGHSDSLFLNASTWALMLTGRVIGLGADITADVAGWINRVAGRIGETAARAAMSRAVRILASEFVLGRTIDEALARAGDTPCSFDMLGEGARTHADASRYANAYLEAIRKVAAANQATKAALADGASTAAVSGISIKLSALHPRLEPLQRRRVLGELCPTLLDLAAEAAALDVPLTIDAEEAQRLELSLELFEKLAAAPALRHWHGLGLAVQAYAKRAPAVIDFVDSLRRPILVRLVKGAYWDAEIKRAQMDGLAGYPVYTRKASTDVSYLACAAKLLRARNLAAQFATHNAHTVAAILALDAGGRDYEFQRLHGMGELLYAEARRQFENFPPVRVYAPVGAHKDLLAYLVRRLLENGANSSFVNRFLNDGVPLAQAVPDPVDELRSALSIPHPRIPLPADLFGAERRNSAGLDVGNGAEVSTLLGDVTRQRDETAAVTTSDVAALVARATAAFPAWQNAAADIRRRHLEQLADLLQANRARLVAALTREAGKTLLDAVAEVREAIDFCRYYGAECQRLFAKPMALPGPTGESNTLSQHGRGVFVCISPWNFPLAIFTGQTVAAVAAGNTVVAKPAPQTTTIAKIAVELMHQAGLPADVVCLATGDADVGAEIVADQRIAGVAFTGSSGTAKTIERALAAKDGPIVPFIAETGGQNAMVVDSTALPEQVVDDVVASAFRSAGQRCSSLRVLYLQDDIAEHLLKMLIGAMRALTIGAPDDPATDVGPVIDAAALSRLRAHVAALQDAVLFQCPLPVGLSGHYMPPTLLAIDGIADLDAEHFGPVLHVVRYAASGLGRVLGEIAAAGYGLTFGVHSRIDGRARHMAMAVGAGNAYVNRDMIGAVVGVQPFGGEGLSGTGPKAGGPHYLPRFAVERALTWNTAATGGNAALLNLANDAAANTVNSS